MRDVTKVTLAKLQRVNKSTVTRWCTGPLEAAMVGDRIDLDHEAAQAFFRQRRVEQQAKDAAFRAPGSGVADQLRDGCDATGGPGSEAAQVFSGDFDVYSMTFEEAHRLGPDFLKSYNLFEDGRKKRLANDEKEGRLISRQAVEVSVLGFVDSVTRRILSDAVETGARLLYGHAKAGDSLEVGKSSLYETLSSHLTPARDQIVQSLLDAASDESEPTDETSRPM